jgi:TolA-binding protein
MKKFLLAVLLFSFVITPVFAVEEEVEAVSVEGEVSVEEVPMPGTFASWWLANVTEKFDPELMKIQHDYRAELKELKETAKYNRSRIKELKDKILPRLSREQKKAQEDVTAWLLLAKADKKSTATTSLKYLTYNKESFNPRTPYGVRPYFNYVCGIC